MNTQGVDMFNADRALREYGRFEELDNPKISVVIPAHNEEGYISGAVESVLSDGRNYRGEVDLHVVNNGSTDRTEEAVKKYGQVVRLYNTEESGQAFACNYGEERVTGDVVVWLDADTKVPDGIFDRIKESIRNGYAGGFASIETGSNGFGDAFYFGWQNFFNKMLTPVRNISRYLPASVRQKVPKTGQGALIYVRKDILDKMKSCDGYLFREDLKSWFDVDFISRLHNYGWVDFINDKPVVTSDRRLRKEGLARMWLKRTRGYFFPEIESKKEYPAYRPDLEVE